MGPHTSLEMRNLIINHFKNCVSQRRIAEMVQVPRGTIKNIIKRDERWIVNKCRSNPKLSAPNIRDLVAKHLQVNCHAETIRRVLYRSGLHGRIARKKPFVSAKNKRDRE
ncbi:uncharacterized protein LOC142231215 [Haematobia irritans]|uniref:uncharacterized protein LOC142231215 n=1 Tax=Haematobia irritans TaxID=7368 RepID=UPI003F50887D